MESEFKLTPPVYEPWLLEGIHPLDIFLVLCELVLKRGYVVLASAVTQNRPMRVT
jgi:hypothetical protein